MKMRQVEQMWLKAKGFEDDTEIRRALILFDSLRETGEKSAEAVADLNDRFRKACSQKINKSKSTKQKYAAPEWAHLAKTEPEKKEMDRRHNLSVWGTSKNWLVLSEGDEH